VNCLKCGSDKPLHVWDEQPRWGYCMDCMAPHDLIDGKLVDNKLRCGDCGDII